MQECRALLHSLLAFCGWKSGHGLLGCTNFPLSVQNYAFSVTISGMTYRWSHRFQLVVTSSLNCWCCTYTWNKSSMASFMCFYFSSSSRPGSERSLSCSFEIYACNHSIASPICTNSCWGIVVCRSTGSFGNF